MGLPEEKNAVFKQDGTVARGTKPGLRQNKARQEQNHPAYEGGVREPWLVKWPGVTKAGSVCDVLVIFTDIFPTVLEMVGLPFRPELHLDGTSIAPLLKGKSEAIHDALFWHYPHYASYGCGPYSEIREGDWTLIEWLEDESVDLFNLVDDIAEQNNLAGVHPKKVSVLRKKPHQWRKDVDANIPRPRSGK